MSKYLIRQEKPQVPPYDAACMAQGLRAQLAQFLFPLLVELDEVLDKRLVRTFLQIIAVILTCRDRANGLLLSELGSYLLSPDQAPGYFGVPLPWPPNLGIATSQKASLAGRATALSPFDCNLSCTRL